MLLTVVIIIATSSLILQYEDISLVKRGEVSGPHNRHGWHSHGHITYCTNQWRT